MVEFTKEEVNNLLILIDAGSRGLASQNQLDKAANILAAADALSKKVAQLSPVEKEKTEE